ncbi:MAG: tripartite tricarboxylate transporter substrate binding protein [Pseudomonadota bacterium]
MAPFIGAGAATAQSYPVKTIRIIVPYTPGGSTDVVSRILAPRLTEILGQTVVVENRPGGSSTIGVNFVAKSPPDGYTLGIVNIAFVANPSLMKKVPYDTEMDLVPVSLVSTATLVMAVHPSVPARSVKELIALAKAKPGSLNYGSAGTGAGNHLMTERFSYMAGIKMVHVPYKGGGPSVLSLVTGETALLLASIPSAIQHFPNGRLVPLAVGSLKRNVALPDVPSIAEAAIPGFEAIEWIGVAVPAGTPPAVIGRLHQALAKVLSIPEVKERIVGLGMDPVGNSPEEFAAFIKKEIASWSKVIKEVGITIE